MVSLADIQKADQVIDGKILRTPLIYSSTFSREIEGQVCLKLENLQKTGSFKLRGATYKILADPARIGPLGVVAASAGNHAQGVALAARQAGIPATIIMPEWVSLIKQEATRAYGGQVLLKGQSLAECIEEARKLADQGMTFIHPFDDPEIIAGQGTIALEILKELPDPDAVVVPIGGGGLIAGIATALKAVRPQTRIFGVQAAACPSAYRSCQAGQVLEVKLRKTIADGISVKKPGSITFPIIKEKVDRIVLVEEEEIADAVLRLLERKRVLAEGAGAVSLAALLGSSKPLFKGSKVVLLISGGNLDIPLLDRILREGLMRNGRVMKFTICLDDVPGTLASLLTLIAHLQANVLHISHERSNKGVPIHMSRLEFELETRGWEHLYQVAEALEKSGYAIDLK